MRQPVFPSIGADWRRWAFALRRYIEGIRSKLEYYRQDDIPAENGVILWNEEDKQVVVSIDDQFMPLSLGYNACGFFKQTGDLTVAAINTAYSVTFNTTDFSNNVSIGTPTSRIVFAKPGRYLVNVVMNVNLSSGGGISRTGWFWLRKNGTDITNSAFSKSVSHVSHVDICTIVHGVEVTVDDYIEVMYAADNTGVFLDSQSSSAFAPAVPSVV